MFAEPEIILASASPRRIELIRTVFERVTVVPCPYPEPTARPPGVSPAAWAEALSYFKARAVADVNPDRWVLGADTIVVCRGELLGKPRDLTDARRMLEFQAGRSSEVITGLSLVRILLSPSVPRIKRTITHATTRVHMRESPEFMNAYLESGNWAGKAGAYGIQDTGDELIERIEGSFTNVVGLPTELLETAMLAALS